MKSRRIFVKIAVTGIFSFFIFIWNKLTLQHISGNAGEIKKFPFNNNKKVFFSDSYIVVSENDLTTIFSARCTHLGCKINKMEGDRFVCPCHGSEYDLSGKVIKGPAYKNLQIIPSQISEDGSNILIEGWNEKEEE